MFNHKKKLHPSLSRFLANPLEDVNLTTDTVVYIKTTLGRMQKPDCNLLEVFMVGPVTTRWNLTVRV